MTKLKEHKFAVYFNKHNPHVTIHQIGMCPLEMHGGKSVDQNQSGWGYFVNERAAELFAKGIRQLKNIKELKYCKRCRKKSKSDWHSE